ncbi:MAG: beta-mannosidase [Roseiflexus sp.]
MRQIVLSSGWRLRQYDPSREFTAQIDDEEGWIPATVPGVVHQDLIAAGLLPDPFDGLNEYAAQWVGEVAWLYRCDFDAPDNSAPDETVVLCCDGLDTFATVWLNDAPVLTNDNMFVPRRAEVTRLIRRGRNRLMMLFDSALRRGRAREAEGGVLPLWNGDSSRLYVRKAQYHYGWDWGPTLLTAGPWRPVRLEFFTARIADVSCPVEVDPDLHHATVAVQVEIEAGQHAVRNTGEMTRFFAGLTVQVELIDPDGAPVATAALPVEGGSSATRLHVPAPRLWWPNGYGDHPLYRLVTTLHDSNGALDRRELRIGLRRLRLVQAPLDHEPGTTFLFEVNNIPIFCGGANWIPADSFVTRIAPEMYRGWCQQAAAANMVMLRVWGGGIYEDDTFYDACDELGLLVWQDFMFACGIYPAPGWFRDSVRAEAEAQVRRLRHHPCLALWCGNNEDYQIAAATGRYDPNLTPEENADRFPARLIYERLLPDICAVLDPTRPYWPGSPYGGADGSDQTFGDRHTWDVWHGRVAPYQEYVAYHGRFVSEFGMQAFPDRATIEAFAPPAERYPQSRTLDHHNKAADGPRRLAVYLSDNVRIPSDLDGYIYATQLVQAEALAMAIRSWRRRWGGPGRYATAGALVWQLNDCWPVNSWSLIDYYRRAKPALYAVRRALAPIAPGLARTADSAELWVVNGTTAAADVDVELRTWTLGGDLVVLDKLRVSLLPNRTTELGQFGFDPGSALIFDARVIMNDQVVARASLWPEPLKYLTLPDPVIVLDLASDDELHIRAARPAKGVVLSAGDGVAWSDNYLDLMPGDEQVIRADGLGERPLSVRWLGMD